jgi:hypothetical protein
MALLMALNFGSNVHIARIDDIYNPALKLLSALQVLEAVQYLSIPLIINTRK